METLYVRNLNEKVSVNTLRRLLKDVFAKFGDVVLITAHKNLRMKGQAFVTFANLEQSAKALAELQLYELFQRPIDIQYAKNNSDEFHITVKKDTGVVEKRKQQKAARQLDSRTGKRKGTEDSEAAGTSGATKQPAKKKIKIEDWKRLPPNKVLLLQNTNADLDEPLQLYFEAFQGFISTRLVRARNLAFVEFESEEFSRACLEGVKLDDMLKLGSEAVLTYAKK